MLIILRAIAITVAIALPCVGFVFIFSLDVISSLKKGSNV